MFDVFVCGLEKSIKKVQWIHKEKIGRILEKCILIASEKWEYIEAKEERWNLRRRETHMRKSPSQSYGCRRQSIINGMQIISGANRRCGDGCHFPLHRRLPQGMAEKEEMTY